MTHIKTRKVHTHTKKKKKKKIREYIFRVITCIININSHIKKNQFSSVQFSFISAPPHEQNNKMLKSLCVVKDGVRKRKKQQNELTLCLAN